MALLSIDDFTFEVGAATFDDITHSLTFRWAEQARLKRVPAQSFLGVGALEKTISGVIYPTNDAGGEVVGVQSLDRLATMAAEGIPYELVSGTGTSYGKWVVRTLSNKESAQFDNGKARKQEFTLTLSYYGEDDETDTNPDALRTSN